MNRRHTDTRLRVWLRKLLAWVRDPWNQTHLIVFGVIAPAMALTLYWRVA
jgi:hypothetical protein